MFSRLKPFVEHRFPQLAYLYRSWRDVYTLQHQVPVQTPLGFKLMGHPHMQDGSFELEQVDLVRELLQNADIFIDIGANVGYYTCLARSFSKYTLAIEPLPQNLTYLYSNLLANDWTDVEVLPVALAQNVALTTLYGANTGASLIKGWANMSPLLRQTVPVSTLDLILSGRFADKKLVIKVDVEGAEYQLLRGAKQTIERFPAPVWIVEIALGGFHPGGRNPYYFQTFNLFFDMGYYAYSITKPLAPVLIQDVQHWMTIQECNVGSENFVFSQTPFA